MRKQTKLFFEFGPFRLDVEKGRLSRSGEIILLPPKAILLLLTLLRQQGRVVEKEVLLETLWPDTVVEDSNLTQTVHLLRKAIGKDADSGARIETLPKIGYRLIAEVREVWEDLDHDVSYKETFWPGASPQVVAETPPPEVSAEEVKIPGLSRPSLLTWFQSHNARISVLALAGIIAGAVFALSFSSAWRETGVGKAGSVAVAVLPFHSLDAANTAPSLSLGMVQTLITKLKSAKGIDVLPTAAVSGYYKKDVQPLEAGRALEVDAVITGHLEKVDGRLRLTVQLRRVTDGQMLLNEHFDEPFNHSSESDALENKIVEKVTAALERPGDAGR